jgi:hypothetical protein
MAEKALKIIEEEIAELETALPADIMSAELDTLNGAELMARGSLSGLRQLNRIIEQPIYIEDQTAWSLKQQRLVGDMAHALLKQARERAEGERNYDLIGRLLAAMAAE